MKIENIEMTVRLYNILLKHKIQNIEDMNNVSEEEIISWRDLGRRSLEELLTIMKHYDIKLKKS